MLTLCTLCTGYVNPLYTGYLSVCCDQKLYNVMVTHLITGLTAEQTTPTSLTNTRTFIQAIAAIRLVLLMITASNTRCAGGDRHMLAATIAIGITVCYVLLLLPQSSVRTVNCLLPGVHCSSSQNVHCL